MKRQKNNMNQVLEHSNGRFMSVEFVSGKTEGKMCAKLTSAGNTYLTLHDINTAKDRRVKRSNIKRLSCGNHVYAA